MFPTGFRRVSDGFVSDGFPTGSRPGSRRVSDGFPVPMGF